MQKRKLTVEIMGGLGNQLFQLGAAIYLSKQGYDVQIDSLYNDIGNLRKVEIEKLSQDLGLKYVKRKKIFLYIFRSKVSRNLFLLVRGRFTIFETTKFQQPIVLMNEKRSRIFGYWQNLEIAEQIRVEINALVPKESRDMIAIHVRRGDYLSVRHQMHGVLNGEYYLAALTQAFLVSKNRKVVIFTDSPEIVRLENWHKELEQKCDVSFSKLVEPWETLVTLATYSTIICSNSTFSWWAAYLGEGKNIFLPSKWFKDTPIPPELVIKNSRIIKAYFF